MYERVRNEDRQRAPAGTGSFRLAYNGKYQYRVNCIDHLGMQFFIAEIILGFFIVKRNCH